jgi:hypothetical protein
MFDLDRERPAFTGFINVCNVSPQVLQENFSAGAASNFFVKKPPSKPF